MRTSNAWSRLTLSFALLAPLAASAAGPAIQDCSAPGEARSLTFTGKQTLSWSPPLDPGSQAPLRYDTLRTTRASDFVNRASATCIEIDGADEITTDAENPSSGRVFFYQVGAKNPCGEGPLGTASNGAVRFARSCSGGNGGLEAPNDAGRPFGVDMARQPTGKNGWVFLHSGEYVLEQTDLRIPGRGFDFVWTRKYRSREGRPTRMGQGWDFSYDIRVEVSGNNPADRWLHDGDGRRDTYVSSGGNCFAAEGFFRELCLQGDGTYLVTFPDQRTWKLAALDGAPAAGRLLEIRDRNQNVMTFAYDAIGRLMTVTDTLGRPIQVSYDADGYISIVTDFGGRQVRYAYYQDADPGGSRGDLKSCTSPVVIATPTGNDYPSGKTTTYTYTENFLLDARNHNLLTITDASGQVFLQNEYTPADDPLDPTNDRIDRQTFPSGLDSYVYVRELPAFTNDFATTKTIVNDRAGNVREASFNARNQLVILREYTGRAGDPTNSLYNRPAGKLRPDDPDFFETRYEYDNDSLPTRVLPPNAGTTRWVYELDVNPAAPRRLQGNLREVHRLPGPLGGDQTEIVETFEYEPGFGGTSFVSRHVDGRGNQTLHTYDAQGDRTHTQHRIPTIVEDYEYNSFGQMTAHVLPDNGSAIRRRDEYVYHTAGPQFGYLMQEIVDAALFALTTTYQYDLYGNIVEVVDPRGHATDHAVNALNQIVRTTSREVTDGSGIRYMRDTFYDMNDNISRVDVENRDELGDPQANDRFTTSYFYDALDRRTLAIEEVSEIQNVLTGYVYDANDHTALTLYGEAMSGHQSQNTLHAFYDERDLLFQEIRAETDASRSTTQYDYDGNGNLKATLQGLESGAHATTSTYDGFDRRTTSLDPMGNVTTFHYDANGNLASKRVDGELLDVPGSAGNVRLSEKTYTYDAMDRRIRSDVAFFDAQTQAPILDGGSTTETNYTGTGQVSRVQDDNAHATGFYYDSACQLRIVKDARSNSTTFDYDASSNVVKTTELDRSDLGSPNETFVTTFTYDNLDRLTSTVDNAQNTTVYKYDSRGNRVIRIDARGNETRYGYDGLGRLVETVRDMNGNGASVGDSADILTVQTWDDSSRVSSRSDDKENTTRYAYDGLDRRIVTQLADGTLDQVGSGASWPLLQPDPDLSLFTSGYDAHDNVIQRTDENGSVITSSYDALDRPTSRSILTGPGVIGAPLGTDVESYQYDGLSRLTRAQDNDSIVTRGYDSLSNVTRETEQIPPAPIGTTTFVYDGDGTKTSTVYPGLREVRRLNDALHRPTVIFDAPGGPGTTISRSFYKGARRVERRTYGNDTSLDVSHDLVRRINHMTYSRTSTGTVFDDRGYVRDEESNRIGAHRLIPLPAENTVYTYDAINRLRTSQVLPGGSLIQYDLDGVGNRTSAGYTMDGTLPEPADSQMNQYTTTPFETSRLYDTNGNLTQSTSSPPRTFGYDYRNQLVQFSDPGSGHAAAYCYDALGRRVQEIVNGVPTRFYYDGLQEIEEQNSSNATAATVVWGGGENDLVQMVRSGQKLFCPTDDQGSPIKVTSSTGSVLEQYKYTDFGEPAFFSGSGSPIPATAIGNPYLFLARRRDPETSLGVFGPRMLNHAAGRYEQRAGSDAWDSLGNARAFASNNPTSVAGPDAPIIVDDFFTLASWEEDATSQVDSAVTTEDQTQQENPPPKPKKKRTPRWLIRLWMQECMGVDDVCVPDDFEIPDTTEPGMFFHPTRPCPRCLGWQRVDGQQCPDCALPKPKPAPETPSEPQHPRQETPPAPCG